MLSKSYPTDASYLGMSDFYHIHSNESSMFFGREKSLNFLEGRTRVISSKMPIAVVGDLLT